MLSTYQVGQLILIHFEMVLHHRTLTKARFFCAIIHRPIEIYLQFSNFSQTQSSTLIHSIIGGCLHVHSRHFSSVAILCPLCNVNAPNLQSEFGLTELISGSPSNGTILSFAEAVVKKKIC